MDSSFKSLTFSLLIFLSLSLSSSLPNPKSLIFPISKDQKTLQYTTQLAMGTPLVTKKLVVDLGGRYLWIDCEKGPKSSTHKPGPCGSSTCSITKPYGFGCTDCKQSPYKDCNNTCSLIPVNTVTGRAWFEAVRVDTVSASILNGRKSALTVNIPNFIFSCGQHNSLLKGLAKGAEGMFTLGRTTISMPNQFSSAFGGSMRRKFAICLPSDSKSNGVILFGDAKYIFYPTYNTSQRKDVSYRFTYTPLIINPISTSMIYMDNEKSADYFIGLKSILVNKKAIPINAELLTFDKDGFGGTMISTVVPYTILETSIYNAFVDEVVKDFTSWNITRLEVPVSPFTACFDTRSSSYSYSQLGPYAPDIEFVMQNKNEVWGMYGYNVMVEVSREVVCLGFVEGQTRHIKPAIVIGAHQLQNNLLQFDLASSRLAFSGTLLWEEIACSNYVPTL